jgi:hypothetical protein
MHDPDMGSRWRGAKAESRATDAGAVGPGCQRAGEGPSGGPLAEAAVAAYFADWAEPLDGECGRCLKFYWRVADDLDYLVTLATLRILDVLAGPLPETSADRQRARDRERIELAFPEIEL